MVSKSVIWTLRANQWKRKLCRVWITLHFFLGTQLDLFPTSLAVRAIKCKQKWCAPSFLNYSVNPSHTYDNPLTPACYKISIVNFQAAHWTRHHHEAERVWTLRSPVGGVLPRLGTAIWNFMCEITKLFSSLSHGIFLDFFTTSVTLTNTEGKKVFKLKKHKTPILLCNYYHYVIYLRMENTRR